MKEDKTNTEYERFNKTMKKVLKVSKQELDRRLEAEKRSKTSASPGPAASR
jgi:hypothetical protein